MLASKPNYKDTSNTQHTHTLYTTHTNISQNNNNTVHTHLPPKQSTNATKAAAELRAFLGAVRDELQRGAEGLVVVGQPLHQSHALHNL